MGMIRLTRKSFTFFTSNSLHHDQWQTQISWKELYMRVGKLFLILFISYICLRAQTEKEQLSFSWPIDNISNIGGYPVAMFGTPEVEEFPEGKAVLFNGINDGLIVQGCPINRSSEFTIEIIFKPNSSFPNNIEQRFVHIQKPNYESRRMLIELRLNENNGWFVDTHIRADSMRLTSLAKDYPHPVGRWYHIAFVYKNGIATHYVNGIKEMSGSIDYIPVDSAYISLGMRMDKRSFFKGAIRSVRLTRRALLPSEFLNVSSYTKAGYRVKELLFSDDFEKQNTRWIAECEDPSTSTVRVEKGMLDISSSAGATVWFNKKLSGNVMITYDATVQDAGGIHDRVSDLNAFWMATDTQNENIFTRSGKFSSYDNLNLYYAGIGGHDNRTTRFRKYDHRGEKPVIEEYTDADHLLLGNTLYKIMIIVNEGRTQFFLNGMPYFDYTDKQPYTEGYFAFRTTRSHQQIDNFAVFRIMPENK